MKTPQTILFINNSGEGAQVIFLCSSAEVMYFEKSEI